MLAAFPNFRVHAAILFLLILAAPLMAQTTPAADTNTSVKPGDDFYRYANGDWLSAAVLPPGAATFDTRTVLRKKTSERVRDLIQQAAASNSAEGSAEQKVGDYYASLMNHERIEAKGFAPLAKDMAAIAAINDKRALSAYLGSTLNTEVDGLVSNADHAFGLWVSQGFEDSKRNLPHLWQGGLGMADRESYLDASATGAQARAEYQAHVAKILKLAGIADADTKAAAVVALEIKMARAHAPDSDAADAFKQNNPWKRSDFPLKAPGMDWDFYFRAAGLSSQTDFVVWQPSAVTGTSALVESEPLEQWKEYLRFHLIEHYALVLPKSVAADQSADREKVAIAATNGALGHAVGQLYTQKYFPPQAKAKAQAMVRDLIAAYRVRIANAAWMSPETKEKALQKLNALTIGVGYPDKWIDYSSFDVVRGDAFGNMRRAEQFLRLRNLALLQQPADPAEWRIEAQSFGAIIMFTPNSEFFSAGLLQAPFFDPEGDTASNYGSAGAAMAHEITHSFDELGNIYDAEGRLGKWWSAEDAARYQAAAARLVGQFDGYCPLEKVCVNGKQVLNENSADLAGLLVAHDAYILSLKGKPDAVINGLTGEQRFFLAFAQRWRNVQTEAALRKLLQTDIHSPGEYRSDTVRNVDAWYKAFDVAPGDKLYLAPEDRASVW